MTQPKKRALLLPTRLTWEPDQGQTWSGMITKTSDDEILKAITQAKWDKVKSILCQIEVSPPTVQSNMKLIMGQ